MVYAPYKKRWLLVLSGVLVFFSFFFFFKSPSRGWNLPPNVPKIEPETLLKATTHSTAPTIVQTTEALKPTSTWATISQHYPVHSTQQLPPEKPGKVFSVQHAFTKDDLSKIADDQRQRRDAVKEVFQHAWFGYKKEAWLKDEVEPISGGFRNSFGGLAATLVDALDSLWILGLQQEFEEAVGAIAKIDFGKSEEKIVNLFEYTIRYLGGLLGAFEISERKYPVLLEKAIEMGEMLYAAFDTPNRMPVTRWEWKLSLEGHKMEASDGCLVAELASLSLEFATLSRLSKNDKYYDAIQRITDELQTAQNRTKLPGMWPVVVDARTPAFDRDNTFTLGAMSDSLYEYLPKQHLLFNGATSQYREMYEDALVPIKKHLLFRPMTEHNADVLLSGDVHIDGSRKASFEPRVQHLGCFAGGMLALGARIMENDDDLKLARKLTEGCIWAYNSTQSNVMPEVFHITPCSEPCSWQEEKWFAGVAERLKDDNDDPRSKEERVQSEIHDQRLVPGYTSIEDRRYILRPEAIESIFYLYRITGDPTLLDKAWDMFTAIRKISETDIANAAVDDVTLAKPPQSDRMESFWLAETLKYFFLIFSDPNVVSLDRYVLNTEAHPYKIGGI